MYCSLSYSIRSLFYLYTPKFLGSLNAVTNRLYILFYMAIRKHKQKKYYCKKIVIKAKVLYPKQPLRKINHLNKNLKSSKTDKCKLNLTISFKDRLKFFKKIFFSLISLSILIINKKDSNFYCSKPVQGFIAIKGII